MYGRILENNLKRHFFRGKALIIVGSRQIGKTTLLKKVIEEEKVVYFNCDNPTERELLNDKDIEQLQALIGENRIIAIDEAQKVPSIGQTIKLLVDSYGKKKQVIATGSSAFNLLTRTQEPLTGRKRVFQLYPLSIKEIFSNKLSFLKKFSEIMRFGSYPEVINSSSYQEKKEALREIASSYLYKDLLEFQDIRNANVIFDLVRLLAFQIGNEVSYTELANNLGIDKKTVERYIDILEKSYVIFRLRPFKYNKRRSIKKHNKIYFYDLGIRNTVINNFNELKFRDDLGALFENLCVVERMKHNNYKNFDANQFFFRSYDGLEVDLIEETDGKLLAYEFKLGKGKSRKSEWKKKLVTKSNLWEFV